MPITLPNPITQAVQSNTARTLTQHQDPGQGWKLNQVLNAQVVRLSSGDAGLRINGQLYAPVSPLGLAPGTIKQLRVASLGPVLKLAWVNSDKTADIPVRLVNAAANSMSNSLWANIVATGPYKLATLLSLMQNPPRVMGQYLPTQTQTTLTALSGLLPKPEELRTGAQIKAVLGRLTLNGQSPVAAAASPLATLLQRLQQQLLLQVANSRSNAPQHKALTSYKADQAMRASLATALLNLLDEATLTNTHRYARALSPENHYCQWQWQFPLLEGSRGRLFSVSVKRHERRNRLSGKRDKFWQLRCACSLAKTGQLVIIIRVHGQQTRIHLQCDNADASKRLRRGEPALKELLQQHKLKLLRFRCIHKPLKKKLQSGIASTAAESMDFQEHSSLSESLNERMRHAAICGELPLLDEFEMLEQHQEADISAQLPDTVYQALACLFVYLLDH